MSAAPSRVQVIFQTGTRLAEIYARTCVRLRAPAMRRLGKKPALLGMAMTDQSGRQPDSDRRAFMEWVARAANAMLGEELAPDEHGFRLPADSTPRHLDRLTLRVIPHGTDTGWGDACCQRHPAQRAAALSFAAESMLDHALCHFKPGTPAAAKWLALIHEVCFHEASHLFVSARREGREEADDCPQPSMADYFCFDAEVCAHAAGHAIYLLLNGDPAPGSKQLRDAVSTPRGSWFFYHRLARRPDFRRRQPFQARRAEAYHRLLGGYHRRFAACLKSHV